MIVSSDFKKVLSAYLGIGVLQKVLLCLFIDRYNSRGKVVLSVENIAKLIGCSAPVAEKCATKLYESNLITGIKYLGVENGEEQYEFVLNKTFLKNRFPELLVRVRD